MINGEKAVLGCAYWEDRMVPSIKVHCDGCGRALCVSKKIVHHLPEMDKILCLPCLRKEDDDEIIPSIFPEIRAEVKDKLHVSDEGIDHVIKQRVKGLLK